MSIAGTGSANLLPPISLLHARPCPSPLPVALAPLPYPSPLLLSLIRRSGCPAGLRPFSAGGCRVAVLQVSSCPPPVQQRAPVASACMMIATAWRSRAAGDIAQQASRSTHSTLPNLDGLDERELLQVKGETSAALQSRSHARR
jgi:hypothetical protein